MIENVKGELIVRREVKFVYGFQAELDRLYGWGLQWGRGYKTKAGPEPGGAAERASDCPAGPLLRPARRNSGRALPAPGSRRAEPSRDSRGRTGAGTGCRRGSRTGAGGCCGVAVRRLRVGGGCVGGAAGARAAAGRRAARAWAGSGPARVVLAVGDSSTEMPKSVASPTRPFA